MLLFLLCNLLSFLFLRIAIIIPSPLLFGLGVFNYRCDFSFCLLPFLSFQCFGDREQFAQYLHYETNNIQQQSHALVDSQTFARKQLGSVNSS